ncbi:MAG: hypothetical protein K6D90_00075 [Lachnospiraceae bacterium]|nr:hypothetical protein [Lachnospiraceae bacterium]
MKLFTKENLKKQLPLILSAFLLSYTICFYAPVELFLKNSRNFEFGLMNFLWMPVVFALAVFFVCVLAGFLIAKNEKAGIIYTGVIFAGSLCIYVQANFLNMTVGTMNGKEIIWEGYRTKMLLYLVILLIIFAAVLVFFIIKSKLAMKISLFVCALLLFMQIAALISLLIPAVSDGRSIKGERAVFTGDGLYEIGDSSNIIVFVLDSYDNNYFRDLLEEDPAFTEELPGFTWFSDHAGTNYETQYGVIPLVMGQLYYNEAPKEEWVESVSENRMFYDELLDQGYDLGIYTDSVDAVPERIKAESVDFKLVPLKFKSNFTVFKHLYRMVACKYLPDIVKPYIWLHGQEFEGLVYSEEAGGLFSSENAEFIAGLEANGLTIDPGKKSYRLIHLWGAHAPFDLNEDGYPTNPTFDVSAIKKGALRMAIRYMEEMKKNGTYENSSIIITADHGNEQYDGELSNPLLLIKPAGVSEGFTVNDAPAWQPDFAATVVYLSGSENDKDYGTNVFDLQEGMDRERFLYSYVYGNVHKNVSLHKNGIRNLVEYRIPSDKADPMRYELTGREFLPTGEVIDHFQYCDTCKNHIERDTSTGYVTWVHMAAPDHPLMCDCESWW